MRVVYLHGFASGPSSTKARYFAGRLRKAGVQVTIPDLAEGDFEHLTITRQLEVVDREVAGRPVVLIGSSMGGYLAALYAASHPEVDRLVLLAPAFGFGRRWPEALGADAMQQWRNTGKREVFHYGEGRARELSYKLIDDAARYVDFPAVPQPVLIMHGVKDDVVPAEVSREFASRGAGNRRLVLFDSGHELTDVLERLWRETAEFLGLQASAGTGI